MTNPELKIKAKEKLASKGGVLAGATFIFGAIYVAIFMAIIIVYTRNLVAEGVFSSIDAFQAYTETMQKSYTFSYIADGIMMIVQAIMATLLAGIQYMCLNSARNQEIKLSDMFHVVKRNPDKVILIYLFKSVISLIISIPVNVFSYMAEINGGNVLFDMLGSLFSIISIVVDVALMLYLSQCVFVFLDNPDESVSVIIRKSIELMKNNARRYLILWISFIPLHILAVMTIGILYLWVLPYMYTTFALFYMSINGEFNQGTVIDEEEVL